ncbi:hypothetical protein [Pedobacter antarcticus]|uniref:hypothetical protein n=1 Tax=Pedobacter antarcticus TaxID=34086 RepID=UPI002931D908|nr:hypothetical protein [Pedobacter antarcticus]
MKNLKYYLIIAALAIGLICLGIGWYKEHEKTSAYQLTNQKVKDQILTGAKEIARTVNSKGAESVLLDITKNHTTVKNVDRTDIPDIVDTAAMALDIRTKQLKEVTYIAAKYKAENLVLKAQLDSNRKAYYTFNGNGLDLKFTPPYDTNGAATADFTGRLGITIAKGNKSKWYAWKDKNLLSVSSDSPYFTIDHVNYIGFDHNPALVNVGASIKTNYNKITGIGVGPAVNIKFGNFEISGDYQYYPKFREFVIGFGGNLSIF